LVASKLVPEYRLSLGSARVGADVKREMVELTARRTIFLLAVLTVNVCSSGAKEGVPHTARKVKAVSRPGRVVEDDVVDVPVVPLVTFE
jgi:hypothetical protein